MKFCQLCFVAVLVFLPAAAAVAEEPSEWIPLFNGKSLDGWTPKITKHEVGENYADTFRVVDGLLTVGYDKYQNFDEQFGHLFYNQEFSNYRMRLEYRFVGDQVAGGPTWAIRNSGIMIPGQSPQSMSKDQKFPVSIEVQLLGGNGVDNRHTGNLCTPGTNVVMDGKLVTRHCTDSSSKTYHGDQWVQAEIEVRGNRVIKHLINGDEVLSYQKPQMDSRDKDAQKLVRNGELMLSGGTISLQSESHPVQFRKVELMPLTEE